MLKDKLIAHNIKLLFDTKHYAFFSKGDFNLNIIGVRGDNRKANKFDDNLFCIYKSKGEWFADNYKITTDAGTHWLKNPMNDKGCAILKCNQFRGAYQLGLHKGQYTALVQRKEVEVYRDNDWDGMLDMNEENIEKGIFGINIHKSNPRTESFNVDKWSAGCQVFKKKSSYDKFIRTCEKAKNMWGNSFTYTLINENELI
jgi:hypothetical protein|tara:strand:- start:2899 stop:3498 length:600 start_codon:yes stop_codon:yes gene_type:complete